MTVLDSTIPPEQQAEAKELAAVLAEMNNNMQHDYQDLVSGQGLHCVHYRLEADIFSGILRDGKQNRYESRDWDGRGKNVIESGRDRE